LKSSAEESIHRIAVRVALGALLVLPVIAVAQQPVIPAPTGLVNDFAGVLDQSAITRITRIAEDVRAKSRGEMAIVTLPSLDGRDVADVALRIGREWKVGKIGNPGDPTRNAGAVILLVPKETNSDGRGRCYIATGQGAEGFITDATAGSICREATPYFIQRDYARGLEAVTLLTAMRFAAEFGFTLDTALVPQQPVRRAPDDDGGFPPFLFFILFFVIMQILVGMTRRRGRRGRRDGCGGGVPIIIPVGGGWRSGGGWGGGGFGGGGGGFGGFGGGGGFSGGGGGSSW
jgi:uncharacterized protein